MMVKKLQLVYKKQPLEIEYFFRRGSDKTLLYLHGGACSKEDFLEITKRTEFNNYEIVAFDFPGCGNSNYPSGAQLDIDDLVEVTHAVIQELDLHQIILVGHSMGGLIGLLYALRYGQIIAFVSIEGNLAPENCVFSRKAASGRSYKEFLNIKFPELQHKLASSEKIGFRKWSESLLHASPQAFYDYCPSIVRYSDDTATLKIYLDLSIPKIYMYGSENKTALKFLEILHIKNCQTVEIPESNHFPFYDNPNAFYAVLHNFLGTINSVHKKPKQF